MPRIAEVCLRLLGLSLQVLASVVFGAASTLQAETKTVPDSMPLDVSTWRHVSFEDIPATSYTFSDDTLKATVNKSASFLLKPFASIRRISTIRFEWRSKGILRVKDAKTEQTKDGDDSLLKLGLLIHGDAPMLPFFAPAWVKMIRDSLKHPTNQLLYLVVGSKNPPGTRWPSPYGLNSSMELLAVSSLLTADGDGWQSVAFSLPKPESIVGLWLMADGDNTGSSFVSELRRLDLQ